MKSLLLSTAALILALAARAQVAPTITTQPDSQAILLGGSTKFSVGVSGTGPFTYQWRFNGTNLPPSTITTVAGTGKAGYSGDTGVATSVAINSPVAVAVDNFGNLFFTEPQWIRMVGTDGIATPVAGTGISGLNYADSAVVSTNARVNNPSGLAFDPLGNLFIADSGNDLVRGVGSDDILTSVAGWTYGITTNNDPNYSGDGGKATNSNLAGPSGIAFDTTGNLFIADRFNNRIRVVDPSGLIFTAAGNGDFGYTGDGYPAVNASLSNPTAVALDGSGNLFIADTGANVIRKVGPSGYMTTVAGNGLAGYHGDGSVATNASLNAPMGIALDGLGNLFIADTSNNIIRRVGGDGIISTIAGSGVAAGHSGDGGAAANATLQFPMGLAFDASGNLYIADNGNNCIREIFNQGPVLPINNLTIGNTGNYDVIVTSPYGSVTSSIASLTVLDPPIISGQPRGLTVAAGQSVSLNVLVGSGATPLVYQWYLNGNALTDQTNNVLIFASASVTDTGDYLVSVANQFGSVTSDVVFVDVGFAPAMVSQPANQTVPPGTSPTLSTVVSGTGPFAYQWRLNGTNIPLVITTVAGNGAGGPANGGFSGDGGPATNASISFPTGVAVDQSGNLLIADCFNNRIRRVDPTGIISTVAGSGAPGFSGDGGLAPNAGVDSPAALALDRSGNLFVSDWSHERIRRVGADGIITTFAGDGVYAFSGDGGAATNATLFGPSGLAVDALGNLFIADMENHRIRRVATNGIITTVAGTGIAVFSGDDGPATNAQLKSPCGVAVDGRGNLFIADGDNYRIRKVDARGIIITIAGNGTNGFSGDGGVATNSVISLFASDGNCNPLALDGFGNLYFADDRDSRVRKIDVNGIITTVAGNGTQGFAGDGGAATSGELYRANSVAVDAAGNLFIGDLYNNRIRKVIAQGPALTLNLVSPTAAGDYQLVVTSRYGSITSSIASLTVTAPVLRIAPATNNSVLLQSTGPVGQTYILQVATSLNPPIQWHTIQTRTADTNGVWSFTALYTRSQPALFYRLLVP